MTNEIKEILYNYQKTNNNLQQRINKAVEYIDEHTIHDTPKKLKNGIYERGELIRTCGFYIEDLLDILRGDD